MQMLIISLLHSSSMMTHSLCVDRPSIIARIIIGCRQKKSDFSKSMLESRSRYIISREDIISKYPSGGRLYLFS